MCFDRLQILAANVVHIVVCMLLVYASPRVGLCAYFTFLPLPCPFRAKQLRASFLPLFLYVYVYQYSIFLPIFLYVYMCMCVYLCPDLLPLSYALTLSVCFCVYVLLPVFI